MDERFSLWATSVQGRIDELLGFRAHLSAESFDEECAALIKVELPWPSNYAETKPGVVALDEWRTRAFSPMRSQKSSVGRPPSARRHAAFCSPASAECCCGPHWVGGGRVPQCRRPKSYYQRSHCSPSFDSAPRQLSIADMMVGRGGTRFMDKIVKLAGKKTTRVNLEVKAFESELVQGSSTDHVEGKVAIQCRKCGRILSSQQALIQHDRSHAPSVRPRMFGHEGGEGEVRAVVNQLVDRAVALVDPAEREGELKTTAERRSASEAQKAERGATLLAESDGRKIRALDLGRRGSTKRSSYTIRGPDRHPRGHSQRLGPRQRQHPSGCWQEEGQENSCASTRWTAGRASTLTS
mmetsp:Transcript_28024/g.82367  ORF Transcript_28024/g.82367 Transcript_28024/m.82367 type:complete len:353 (+) Transcript_28024:71-1129(+)